MFNFFKNASGKQISKDASRLYQQAVAQARLPHFYRAWQVPDSFDGRFDLLILHTGLLTIRLEELGPEGQELAQALYDETFRMLELSCRELGIGDEGLPYHMQRMIKAFNGRTLAYKNGVVQDQGVLKDAVRRNLYGTVEQIDNNIVEAVSAYILETSRHLCGKTLMDFKTQPHTVFPVSNSNEIANVKIA